MKDLERGSEKKKNINQSNLGKKRHGKGKNNKIEQNKKGTENLSPDSHEHSYG